MNRAILYLATFAVLVLCIESRKPASDMSFCRPVDNCKCGTYFADPCEICRRCPGGPCTIGEKKMCAEGSRCIKRKGATLHLHPIRKGTCVEIAKKDNTGSENLSLDNDDPQEGIPDPFKGPLYVPPKCSENCTTGKNNVDKTLAKPSAPVDNCQCGSYFTESSESCRKCPGEQCNEEQDEVCSEGYLCKQGEGLEGADRSKKHGTCVKIEGPHPQEQLQMERDQNGTMNPSRPKLKLLLDIGGDKRH